jgi:hypothetical protein
MKPKFRPDDRVLSLGMPSAADIAAIAHVLTAGYFVALGDYGEVESARRTCAQFNNVTFLESTPDRIPWHDGFFTKVIVPWNFQPLLPAIQNELTRVIAPGGEIVSDTEDA